MWAKSKFVIVEPRFGARYGVSVTTTQWKKKTNEGSAHPNPELAPAFTNPHESHEKHRIATPPPGLESKSSAGLGQEHRALGCLEFSLVLGLPVVWVEQMNTF